MEGLLVHLTCLAYFLYLCRRVVSDVVDERDYVSLSIVSDYRGRLLRRYRMGAQ